MGGLLWLLFVRDGTLPPGDRYGPTDLPRDASIGGQHSEWRGYQFCDDVLSWVCRLCPGDLGIGGSVRVLQRILVAATAIPDPRQLAAAALETRENSQCEIERQ